MKRLTDFDYVSFRKYIELPRKIDVFYILIYSEQDIHDLISGIVSDKENEYYKTIFYPLKYPSIIQCEIHQADYEYDEFIKGRILISDSRDLYNSLLGLYSSLDLVIFNSSHRSETM